ncbi:MAG: DUF4160 domain-containing protein [Fimbriimonadaceae bacterium]|nr:DUF4160 domain-containing protein [Fimbriimonadaceae bacterium]
MPAISMFFGIVIYLHFLENVEHHEPHIHARYQGSHAAFGIESAEVLAGSLPPRQTRLVSAWMNCGVRSCGPTGIWPCAARWSFRSTRCGRSAI